MKEFEADYAFFDSVRVRCKVNVEQTSQEGVKVKSTLHRDGILFIPELLKELTTDIQNSYLSETSFHTLSTTVSDEFCKKFIQENTARLAREEKEYNEEKERARKRPSHSEDEVFPKPALKLSSHAQIGDWVHCPKTKQLFVCCDYIPLSQFTSHIEDTDFYLVGRFVNTSKATDNSSDNPTDVVTFSDAIKRLSNHKLELTFERDTSSAPKKAASPLEDTSKRVSKRAKTSVIDGRKSRGRKKRSRNVELRDGRSTKRRRDIVEQHDCATMTDIIADSETNSIMIKYQFDSQSVEDSQLLKCPIPEHYSPLTLTSIKEALLRDKVNLDDFQEIRFFHEGLSDRGGWQRMDENWKWDTLPSSRKMNALQLKLVSRGSIPMVRVEK